MNTLQTQSGFTIIELLIVISLMMVISVVGIASFAAFNTSQQLKTAGLSVKSMLQYAKSQAMNQVNTCSAGQTLTGYRVLACCTGSGCPTCLGTSSYEVDVVCSGGATYVNGGTLPSSIVFDTQNSTSFSFLFNTLSGTVTGPGTLILKQGATQNTISVSLNGVIQ